MPAPAEALRDLSAPLRRLGGEVASARLRPGVGRDEFVRLCRAYGDLARSASDVLGRAFPPREFRRDDLLLSGMGVRGAALDDPLGLVRDVRQYQRVHKPPDEGGFPGAYRPDDADVDVPSGARCDLLINGCLHHFRHSPFRMNSVFVQEYVHGKWIMPERMRRCRDLTFPAAPFTRCGIR